jgi:hypothetical protein
MTGISQDTRNALNRALFLRRARAHCRTLAFSCFLDEQPSDLVSPGARHGLRSAAAGAALVVNESFRYQPGSDPPDEIRDRAISLDAFLRGYPLAWVEHPGTGVWLPFWARGEVAEVLGSLRAGAPAPTRMAPEVREALVMASVLCAPGDAAAQQASWESIWKTAQEQVETNRYAIVRDLIHPLQLGAMRRYYRALVAEGNLPVGDNQVADRYGLHSELIGSFLHPQLASVVRRIFGEPVKPSYVFFACYQPGSALPRHTDREQCEFSISLLVDYTPDSDGSCGWPLFLEDPRAPGAVVPVDLGVGHAVFYRGRELLHYRDPLPEGHQSTSLFFHYVREDFSGDLW